MAAERVSEPLLVVVYYASSFIVRISFPNITDLESFLFLGSLLPHLNTSVGTGSPTVVLIPPITAVTDAIVDTRGEDLS